MLNQQLQAALKTSLEAKASLESEGDQGQDVPVLPTPKPDMPSVPAVPAPTAPEGVPAPKADDPAAAAPMTPVDANANVELVPALSNAPADIKQESDTAPVAAPDISETNTVKEGVIVGQIGDGLPPVSLESILSMFNLERDVASLEDEADSLAGDTAELKDIVQASDDLTQIAMNIDAKQEGEARLDEASLEGFAMALNHIVRNLKLDGQEGYLLTVSGEEFGEDKGKVATNWIKELAGKLKTFADEKTRSVAVKMKQIKSDLIPTIKNLASRASDVKASVGKLPEGAVLAEGASIKGLNTKRLNVGTGKVESPEELIKRYEALTQGIYGTVIPGVKVAYSNLEKILLGLDFSSQFAFTASIKKIDRQVPLLTDVLGKLKYAQILAGIGYTLDEESVKKDLAKIPKGDNEDLTYLHEFCANSVIYDARENDKSMKEPGSWDVMSIAQIGTVADATKDAMDYLTKHDESSSTDGIAFEKIWKGDTKGSGSLSKEMQAGLEDFIHGCYAVDEFPWSASFTAYVSTTRVYAELLSWAEKSLALYKAPAAKKDDDNKDA